MAPGPRRPGGRRGTLAFVVALLSLAPHPSSAQEASREYQVKAAFLFNFGQFVSWRPEACPRTGEPFVIGVLGQDRFGATLDALVRGQRMYDRPVAVQRYARVEDVGECQMLFISDSETPRLDAIFAALAGRKILTVGESADFADERGIILLQIVDNRTRLEINTGAAAAADIEISSKLLRLAAVVRTSGS